MNTVRNISGEPIWEDALARMKRRIDETMGRPVVGFPHYADQNTGQWTTTPDGFWTGGFWIGELWLASHYWKDATYARAAESELRKLAPRIHSKSVFRSFLFYYGAVLGTALANNDTACKIAMEAAQTIAKAYNPTVGLIPLGVEAEEAHKVGDNESNIDGLIASPLLFWAANAAADERLGQIALAHAYKNAEFCVQSDGSVIQSASFDPVNGRVTRRYTHKGSSPTAIWTRAQAWAMIGYSLCAMLAPRESRFLSLASQVADWWLENVPADFVAYWDFSVEKSANTKRDTSGTAIAAAALLKLSAVHPDRAKATRYFQFARDTALALVQRRLTPIDTSDRRPSGILTDGCFDPNNGVATANELIWGDYYLLESVGVLSGRLGADTA